MLAMLVFGIGEVLGSFFIGQIIDSQGSKLVSLINVVLIVVTAFVTLAFLGINQFNLLAFVMTLLWGFSDATVNTHCFELCGFEFDTNTEPYSLFNLAQAMGVFVFTLIESVIDTRVKYIVYTSFIGLIGVWACGLTYFFEFRNQKS
jgi:predicted MFS family arabinose efflux permease